MSNDDWDSAREQFSSAISEIVPSELVVKWMLTAETLDSDGQRTLLILTAPDTRTWDVMGMAHFALEHAKIDTEEQ